ncbi:hypothetical protein ACTFIZ_010808 [Dictyostelium cf. discoideum]
MIKKIITSTLVRSSQYGKLLNNNFQVRNINTNVLRFPQPLFCKKKIPTFFTPTTLINNNSFKFGNKLNYSTEYNKNKPTDTILKDSIFEKENGKGNKKSFNSGKFNNFFSNATISTIILIVAFYYLSKNAIEKIKESNSKLYNDITNQINESNKTFKELLREMREKNQLIIEQNNHSILIQNNRVLVSIALTFLSLIFFIIDYKKKYM